MSTRLLRACLLAVLVAGCDEGDQAHGTDVTAQEAKPEEQRWELNYAGFTPEELRAEISMLMDVLQEDTDPCFESRFASGEFTLEGSYTPGLPHSLNLSGEELSEVRFLPDGHVGKVVLPEPEYQAAYDLHRQIRWLYTRLGHLAEGSSSEHW